MSRQPLLGGSTLAFCALAAVSPLWAQHYSFKQYGQEQGLANLAITSMLQDRSGFLWVGTQNGLFRYGGRRFRGFGVSDGLPSSGIQSLWETPGGLLWVATRSGLAQRYGSGFASVDVGRSIEIPGIQALASDHLGNLYVATADGLLIGGTPRGSRRSWRTAMSGRSISAVTVKADGAVWFGCDSAIWRLDSSGLTRFGVHQGVPRQQWSYLLFDGRGNLWARSSASLLLLEAGKGSFVTRTKGLPQAGTVSNLLLDRRQHLLASTDLGMAVSTQHGWEFIDKAHGLASNAIACLLEDREGSLWIGLRGTGVARWLGKDEWESWTEANGLTNDVIWAIRRDRSGSLWIGSNEGLNRMLPNRAGWQSWTTRRGLGGNKVRALAVDAAGGVWAGAFPGGVSRVDPRSGRVRIYGASQGMTRQFVHGLTIDRDNRLWVSTVGGLLRSTRLDSAVRFTRQRLPGSDFSETFFSCAQDRKGRLWASGTRGIAVLENGVWTRFTSRDGLLSTAAGYLVVAADGSVWITYADSLGVSRLELAGGRLRVQSYSTRNGLRSDRVYFVGADTRGWIWSGTDLGVDVFDGQRWTHLDRSEGLYWNDCDTNAFWADPDGTVWVGTSRGLSHFHPGSRRQFSVPPPVLVTAARLGNTDLELQVPARAPYSRRSFQARFAALTFLDEDDVRLFYRLRGLEREWVETDQREVRYPKLPPGEYTFEVMARHDNGFWSSTAPASFSFRIDPPWWQSWWARTLFTALLALIACGAWHWRVLGLMSRQRELERAVEARTRELEREKGQLLQAREALREQTMRDGLTGLLNRTAIFDSLRVELDRSAREGKPLAIAMLDLDRFKQINDCSGHIVGDLVLQEAARRMSAVIRSYDSIGRYGGEELLVVFPGCDQRMARVQAERLRLALSSEPFQGPCGPIRVTCSVGLACTADLTVASCDQLVGAADNALYLAKFNGRNRIEVASRSCPDLFPIAP